MENHGYDRTGRWGGVSPVTHCVMDEVHGGADVVEHAPIGHDEISMLEPIREAGREDGGGGGASNLDLKPGDKLSSSGSRPDSLGVSAASGEEVHQAGVDVRLCNESGPSVWEIVPRNIRKKVDLKRPERLKSVLRM